MKTKLMLFLLTSFSIISLIACSDLSQETSESQMTFRTDEMTVEQIKTRDYSSVIGTWQSDRGLVLTIGEKGLLPLPYQVRKDSSASNIFKSSSIIGKDLYNEVYIFDNGEKVGDLNNLIYLPAGQEYDEVVSRNSQIIGPTYLAEEDTILSVVMDSNYPQDMILEHQIFTRISTDILSPEELIDYYTFYIFASYEGMDTLTDEDGYVIYWQQTFKLGDDFSLSSMAANFGIYENEISRITLTSSDESISLEKNQFHFKIDEEVTKYPLIHVTLKKEN